MRFTETASVLRSAGNAGFVVPASMRKDNSSTMLPINLKVRFDILAHNPRQSAGQSFRTTLSFRHDKC